MFKNVRIWVLKEYTSLESEKDMALFESVKAHDGTSLRVARFDPVNKPLGVVQIIHGFGEGLIHYKEIASCFATNGYACVVHDQRGFGEMPGIAPHKRKKVRGVIPGYKYLLEDIRTLRGKIDMWYPGTPVIVFGHSMGGNLAVNYLVGGFAPDYVKAILEAPWLRLYKPLPGFATSVAGLMGKVSSKLTIPARLNLSDISRDENIVKSLENDGVYHNRMSLRLYAEVVKAGERAIMNANKITVPVLLLCPGADKIVCPKAIREFHNRAGENVTLVEYPGAYHCLHADINNVEVVTAMLGFCSRK